LPVIDTVAADYLEDIAFVAVAGRSDMARTAPAAAELISDNVAWGLDDGIWELYGVPGQPASVLIANGVVVDQWFGALGEDALRERLDRLATLSS
jgi:hypothetical protein